jgi:hypothetical protein
VWAEERTGSILDILYFRPRDAALRSGPQRPGGRTATGRTRKKATGGSV